MKYSRVVDRFDARVEGDAGGSVAQLLHPVVERLRVVLVLRVAVARLQRRSVHPVTSREGENF